ncbi:MAG: outer membrane beta-barrel protein [Pseudomonadota bacterium]|nr:outer membrane beta-barrel protein [Pseudomonadota bacterium]
MRDRVQGRTGLGLRALSVLVACACGTGVACAQGATDISTEGQVPPQIIQNPIIPSIPDPEPSFTTAKQDAVMARPRPEYQPIGLEAGGIVEDITWLGRGQVLESFLLFPRVDVGMTFDDNIFADRTRRKADFVGVVSPSVTLRSNWDNHELFATLKSSTSRYLLNGRESSTQFGGQLGGEIELTEFESVRLVFSSDRKTTSRGDVSVDAGGDEPGVFFEHSADLQWQYARDLFQWLARTKLSRRNFVDVPAGLNNEIETDQSDGWRWDSSVRLGYEAWKGTTLFVQPFLNTSWFDNKFDNSGFRRAFLTWGAVTGFTYDVSAVSFLEASVGLGFNNAFDSSAGALTFLKAGLDLVWNPHDSWTFTAGFSREVTPTNSFTIIGGTNVADVAFLTNAFTLGAQLEITYELLASMEAEYRKSSTIANDTQDDVFSNTVALLWLLNENMRVRSFWDFTYFSSNDVARRFLRNRLGVVLTLHY